MPSIRPLLRHMGLVAGLVAFLTACQSQVETTVRVASDGGVSRVVRIEMRDEAASATLASIETAKAAVAKQAGVATAAVVVEGDAEELVLRVVVPEGIVAPASGLGEAVAAVEGSEMVLGLELTDPAELRGALQAAVADQDDAEALREAMGRSVELCVRVEMPGDVLQASESMETNGRAASLCRVLEEWQPGEVQVRSKLSHDSGVLNSALARYAGVSVLLGLAAWVDHRRRRRGV